MTRSGRVLLLAALGVASCAGAARAPAPTPKQSAPADAGAPPTAARDAGDPVPSLETLAERGPSDAPLMREVQRVADASRPIELRAPTDRDVCVRAIYAASRPVRAWIEDDGKTPRGDVAPAAATGLVPPKGPACARRGERLRLVIDGGSDPIVARAVVWQAP